MSSADFVRRVARLSMEVGYREGAQLHVGVDDVQVYIEARMQRVDVYTGKLGIGRGGRRYLAEGMTDGQIVRAMFGAFLAFEEHECREHFTYRGKRIFGPHITLDALVDAADRVDP